MTGHVSSAMLDRLRAVEWMGDWDYAFGHVMSRRVLMREYLRRAAQWALAYSVESEWPFFDVTDHMELDFCLPLEIALELDEYLGQVPGESLRRTCAGAVRMAELREQNPAVLPDLPDLYEPLVRFYERGGEFIRDNAGFLDLTGVSFRPGTLQGHLGTPRLSTLSEAMLDAVDAEGRISYYAASAGTGPLLRRRVVRGAQHDEVFSQGPYWEPTDLLPPSEEEAKEAGWVRLDEVEAAELIGTAVAQASRQRG